MLVPCTMEQFVLAREARPMVTRPVASHPDGHPGAPDEYLLETHWLEAVPGEGEDEMSGGEVLLRALVTARLLPGTSGCRFREHVPGTLAHAYWADDAFLGSISEFKEAS